MLSSNKKASQNHAGPFYILNLNEIGEKLFYFNSIFIKLLAIRIVVTEF